MKVIYFSRTGMSKEVAFKLAKLLGVEAIELKDGMEWSGIGGYIKACYYAMRKKEVKVEVLGQLMPQEEIVLVAPLWAGGMANAAESFLKNYLEHPTHVVITSHGSKMKAPLGVQSFSMITQKENKLEESIAKIASNLSLNNPS